MDRGAWWAAVHGVTKNWTWLSDFTFTFHFHALEKERATHSSVLAWRIPGMGEPGGLPSMGSHRVGHDWSDLAAVATVNLRCKMCYFDALTYYTIFAIVMKNYGVLYEFACYHFVGTMLAFSVLFQFLVYVLPKQVQYVAFCVWLLPYMIMFLRFIHTVACVNISFCCWVVFHCVGKTSTFCLFVHQLMYIWIVLEKRKTKGITCIINFHQ